MLDFSLTALLLTYGTLVVSASSSLNLTNTNNITKAGAASGPLSLGDVYDGLSYSLYGKGAFSYAPIAHHSNSYAGPVTNQWRDYYFSGEDLPLYVIYWGSGFTNTQTSIIQMFLTGIGSHPYWKTVSSYSVGGWTASSPKWSGSVSVPCYYAAPYGVDAANGCYLKQYNEQAILSDFIANGKLPCKYNCNTWATYFIFGGTDVTYTMQSGSVLGSLFDVKNDGSCSIHGVCGPGMACSNMAYAYIPMMTNPSSLCNIISQLPNGKSMYPNYDFALDNAINFALHELIDSILSPQLTKDGWGNVIPNAYGGSSFQDAYGADAAEKCANIIMDVGKFARNANIQVAGYGFIVFPMYHYAYQDCRMQS